MLSSVKESADINLKGKRVKSFAIAASPFVSFIFLLLSILSSFYLLVIDTDLLSNLGIFKNMYLHLIVCLILFSVNVILLCFHIYLRIYCKNYFIFYSIEKINMKIIFKAFILYIALFFIKTLQFIFFIMPFMIVLLYTINIFEKGVSIAHFALLSVCSPILLFCGIAAFSICSQRYFLADVFLYVENNKSIRNAIKQSAIKMNGKCRRSAFFDVYSIYMKFLSLFLIPAVYFIPEIKAQKAYCVLEKEIPYVNKRQHTEKTIVFYFKKADR